MYYEREELQQFAHDAIMDMLSYNVKKLEAYMYLTNKIPLMYCSYELQCCIFDLDPIEYIKVCDATTKNKMCSMPKKRDDEHPLS